MATFIERINELFDMAKDMNHKLTQREYAARFGATRNQLKGWLDGRGEPDSELMKKIAEINGVSVSWLVGESDTKSLIETTIYRRIEDSMADLPDEAISSIEEYIELIRIKYTRNRRNKAAKS